MLIGIGLKELIQTIIAGIISAILGVIINSIFQNYLLAVGIFLGITSITFLLVMKDKNNSSVITIIGNIIKFYKNQKYYKYVIKEQEKGEK